jgi:hypothetical protein
MRWILERNGWAEQILLPPSGTRKFSNRSRAGTEPFWKGLVRRSIPHYMSCAGRRIAPHAQRFRERVLCLISKTAVANKLLGDVKSG